MKKKKYFLTGFVNEQKQQVIDIDEKNFVQQCVKTLKSELRLPVIFHYYIGLNYNEIAEILNTTSRTIEGRIYRAKKKLRIEFEKGGYEQWTKREMI
jgi:RNA polymerase sigma factor (sigma-70 family)